MNTLQATCAHMLPICLLTAAVVSLAEAEPYEVDPGINGVTVHGRVKLGAPLKDTVAVPCSETPNSAETPRCLMPRRSTPPRTASAAWS